MKEEHIVRTSIYIPKSLYLAIKSKEFNVSRLVRGYLEQIIEEDEEEILIQEIEKKKKELQQLEMKLQFIREKKQKENLEKQYILDIATRLTEFLNARFKNFINAGKSLLEIDTFLAKTNDLIERDFGIFIEYEELSKLFKKIKDSEAITKEDILPYVVREVER